VPHLDQLAVKTIATGTRFIAEMQPPSVGGQLLSQFTDVIGTMRHRPPVADFAAAFALCNRDRNRGLVNIKPNERAILHVVSPPFLRLGASQSDATLERRMPRERPPDQSADTAIMGSKGKALQTGKQSTHAPA
jgi:hypothetical protein